MDTMTMDTLKKTFLADHADWCVSLYMPTHRAGRETEQDPIRLKNLLREVEEGLLAKGLRSPEVREVLRAPQRLLQEAPFWQQQSDGLAVFFTTGQCDSFRLPISFDELVVIANRFHVKPLLPYFTSDGHFYILALSQNRIRLLEGTRDTVDEVDLAGVPGSLAEAFQPEPSGKQLQFHTVTPSCTGMRAAMFHGHDLSNDFKDRMSRWFRMIDHELRDLLAGGQSPLVLAGVDYLFPLYREASSYPHLLDEGIAGNPEGLKPAELHSQAWNLVEPIFQRAREEAAARYRHLAGTGHTTTDLQEAVLAAHHGRVEVLFVAVGVQVWGHFDPATNSIEVHHRYEPGDEDLLDLAAIRCLLTGGMVYAVAPAEVPDGNWVAAVYRY